MCVFSTCYSVRGSEMDPEYRLRDFYVGFYFQECFAEFAASKKMAAYDVAKSGLTWLISDARAEIPGPMPFWRGRVKVDVWARSVSPLFLVMGFSMSEGGAEFARGSFRALMADLKTHRPARFPEFARAFSADASHSPDTAPFERLEASGEIIGSASQKVRQADLDFNNHLNNVRYLPRAIESMPLGEVSGRRLSSYAIRYMREAFLGDEIVSESFAGAGGCYFHRLSRVSDGAVLCCAKTFWK